MAVRNLKGLISIPLSSLQIFQAGCPKLKADISIKIFEDVKDENMKAVKNITFFEDSIAYPNPQRVLANNSFGFPKQVPPKLMPSWRELGVSPTVYLLHSLAHIEINAVEIAWDTILRFSSLDLPPEFYIDFISIAADEARHFNLLCDRLQLHKSYYGAIPAHDNLWTIAEKTNHDILARIAAIQLVQEPRALDSAERLINKFEAYGDKESAKIMKLICEEEIGHVKIGVDWFSLFCSNQKIEPKSHFHKLVRQYVGIIPPPFNVSSRRIAGMENDWYLPVSLKSANHPSE